MQRIFVGMSGGIDSSAAAYLLQEQGFKVTGITFTAFREEGYKKCCSLEDIDSAGKVCRFLGIPHKIIDVKDVFTARVVNYFIRSYRAGLTPNPCILCNRYVKFGAMLEYSLADGADFFATGHYSGISDHNGELLIEKGADASRDQSYFLSYIEKGKLPFIKLPLGNLLKKEIRAITEKSGLPISPQKPESQDICFIKNDYRDFLRDRGVKENKGLFVYNGRKIPGHRGIAFYSLGQRRGLSVAAGERIYIRSFDLHNNEIHLGAKPYSLEFETSGLNVFTGRFIDGDYDILFRYRSKPSKGKVVLNGLKAKVILSEPREIISPGQFAVFYRDNSVFAGGPIESAVLLA